MPINFNRNREIIKKIVERDGLIIIHFKKYMHSDVEKKLNITMILGKKLKL